MENYDVIIIGGGPAGLTAGLYTSRSGLKSLLFEQGGWGGQMAKAAKIENYPGFPDGITGSELSSLMRHQAEKYGLDTKIAQVTHVSQESRFTVASTEGVFKTTAVIITTGSERRKLQVAGEERLSGRGVSYCATCDGFFFRNQEVAVIGGGDTAITDALELSNHASKVYLIHRRDQLRAGKVLQQRSLAHPKLEFIWDTEVQEILGDNILSGLKLRDVKTSKLSILKVNGAFIAVGIIPNSRNFIGVLELDESGYISTDQSMAASLPGAFAAGDIRAGSPHQIAAAVGDGVAAAVSALKYVQERGNNC